LRPPRREKSKLLSYNCYFADRSPNTAAGWEPTKEDLVAQKVFGLPAKPMSLRRFNTTTVFLVPQCLADDLKFGTQNAEFILISWNHWMLSGNTPSKCFVFVIENFFCCSS
jgi:hypothetical protein